MKYRHIIFAGLVYVLTSLILDALRYRASLGQQGALANIILYPLLRLDRKLLPIYYRLYNTPDYQRQPQFRRHKYGIAGLTLPDPTVEQPDRALSGAG